MREPPGTVTLIGVVASLLTFGSTLSIFSIIGVQIKRELGLTDVIKLLREAGETIAAEIASGSGYRRTVTSVITPSVPSLPTNQSTGSCAKAQRSGC